jgi:signal transduction histidine kinase
VVRLLETEHYAPGFRPLIRLLITLSLVYAAFRIWQPVSRPSFSYTYILYLAFNIFFMVVSLFIFSALWFRPVPRIKKIIILGSYLLVAGHLFSIWFKDDFYFLNTVLAEIALFYTIIFLQYRRVHEERLRYKLHMLAEQQKRQNLVVLDEMKTRFFSHISHEFRTPLTLMEAALNRLEETVAKPPAGKYLANLRRQAGRLRELLDQLMDISRLQARALKPQIQSGDLKTFVAMVCENFRTPA